VTQQLSFVYNVNDQILDLRPANNFLGGQDHDHIYFVPISNPAMDA
jgi:hypothetical protein